MAAPTNAANVKKALANSEPSTHGTFQKCSARCEGLFPGVKQTLLLYGRSDAIDPIRTSARGRRSRQPS
jgi:hypothetical protein